MSSPDSALKVLLIRPWIHSLAPIRAALRSAGYEARFTRVDIEPALQAAVVRGGLDLAIVDPATPGLSASTIEACVRDHRPYLPIVELGDVSDLAARIKRALAARRS
jgi:hypothetical protein